MCIRDRASSAALALSGMPFMGPVGAARVGYINGEYVLNPTIAQIEESDMDLVVAGTNDAVMMVESEIYELSEEVVLGGVSFAHKSFQPVIAVSYTHLDVYKRQPVRFLRKWVIHQLP